MPATTARPPSDPLDGQCMQSVCSPVRGAQRPPKRPPEHHMVPDDILSTTHDLATTIAAAHQCAYVASLWTHGSSSIERDIVAAAHRRVWLWCWRGSGVQMHAGKRAGGLGHRHAGQCGGPAREDAAQRRRHARKAGDTSSAHVRATYVRLGWTGRGPLLEWHPRHLEEHLSDEMVVEAWLAHRLRTGVRLRMAGSARASASQRRSERRWRTRTTERQASKAPMRSQE